MFASAHLLKMKQYKNNHKFSLIPLKRIMLPDKYFEIHNH